MNLRETSGAERSAAEHKMVELIRVLREREADWERIGQEPLQELIECLLKAYARKLQPLDQIQTEQDISPLPTNTTLSQTEAIVFADRLLREMEIDLFEVQMFRSLCF